MSRPGPLLVLAGGMLMVLTGLGLMLRGGSSKVAASPPPGIALVGMPEMSRSPQHERIKIADLDINLPVVGGDGWNAPFYKAATYPGLGLPGEGHRTVIYAHNRPAMFAALAGSRTGQAVEVEDGRGRVLRYRIDQVFRQWPSTDTRWLQPLDREELVLVTCTTYDPNDPRIIAVAEPVR